MKNRQESLRWLSLCLTFQARRGEETQQNSWFGDAAEGLRELGLTVHREEDPGESSSEGPGDPRVLERLR